MERFGRNEPAFLREDSTAGRERLALGLAVRGVRGEVSGVPLRVGLGRSKPGLHGRSNCVGARAHPQGAQIPHAM